MTPEDLSNASMLELFRVEAENQTAALTGGLLELERAPARPEQVEALMRAAHSLKGAARIVSLPDVGRVAHAMEDCFVAVQKGQLTLQREQVDMLLRGVDLLAGISKSAEPVVDADRAGPSPEVEDYLKALKAVVGGTGSGGAPPAPPASVPAVSAPAEVATRQGAPPPAAQDRVLRLTAENLNRLLGLAGESLVESRWLHPFTESLQRLKRMHSEMEQSLDGLRQVIEEENLSERAGERVAELAGRAANVREYLGERLQELDLFDRRSAHLSNRLYLEVLRARMRPFADGVRRFPRMVRDLARSLGKQVQLEIIGENTQVDRDILDRLEAPLAHLLRNAVDHGCETPEERRRAGKPAEASIRLEARHSAGMLHGQSSPTTARASTSKRVRQTVIAEEAQSGAGGGEAQRERAARVPVPAGLLHEGRRSPRSPGAAWGWTSCRTWSAACAGGVRVSSQPGRGMRFQLQLPLTLSVLRTLLVDIGGEPYAFPLSQIAAHAEAAAREH